MQQMLNAKYELFIFFKWKYAEYSSMRYAIIVFWTYSEILNNSLCSLFPVTVSH